MEAGKVQPLPGISQWASVGDLASIKYLVQKEGPPIFQVTDSHGRTALHWAVDRNQSSIVEYLIQGSTPLDVCDDTGATCLDYASLCGYNSLVDYLNSKGAIKGSGTPVVSENESRITKSTDTANEDKHTKGEHQFWGQQPSYVPVASPSEGGTAQTVHSNSAITDKLELKATTPLPPGLEWSELPSAVPVSPFSSSVEISEQLKTLIREIYELQVSPQEEEDEGLLSALLGGWQFGPSYEMFEWILTLTNKRQWFVGIRETSSPAKRLVGFIAAVEMAVQIYDKKIEAAVEIHSLYIHPDWRGKRLAPLLIAEVGRRCNVDGVSQAVFTTADRMPFPHIARCRDFFRPINTVALIQSGFISAAATETIAGVAFNLQQNLSTSLARHPLQMRLMTKEDLPAVHKLLVAYLDRFALHRLFTEEDVAVRLLPRGDFIKTYVVEDDSGVITDVASYYKLRSPVKKRQRKQDYVNAAVLNYCIASDAEKWVPLIAALIDHARSDGMDVCMALDNFYNADTFLEALRFESFNQSGGTESLYYHVYNWQCPPMSSQDIGLQFW